MPRARDLLAAATTFPALRAAALRAARGHRRTADAALFLCDLERNLLDLQRRLSDKTWEPGPLRTFHIRDPKPRTISAVPFPDRVVHHAICAELVPVLDRSAVGSSFACRPGKGTHAAVRAAWNLTRLHPFALKIDIRHFFETVDHAVLLSRLDRHFDDPPLRALLCRILAAGTATPGTGLPIGSLTSQHLGNFLLSALDQFLLRQLRVPGHVRYMDDTLIFGPSPDALWPVAQAADTFIRHRLHQRLNDRATRLTATRSGVPFLGFRLWPRLIRLDPARLRRLCRTLRRYRRLHAADDESIDLQHRAASTLSWVAQAHTRALLRSLLYRPRVTHCMATESRLEPGESWWELEQQPVERPCGES